MKDVEETQETIKFQTFSIIGNSKYLIQLRFTLKLITIIINHLVITLISSRLDSASI